MLWLRPGAVWWGLIALVTALVLAFELLNSALERFIDHLHPDRHPEIKLVKDMAAAAVLILSMAAVAIAAAMLGDSL